HRDPESLQGIGVAGKFGKEEVAADVNIHPGEREDVRGRGECLETHLPRVTYYTEPVVGVLEGRRNARPRGASADLDVMPPGTPARGSPVAGFGPRRIPLRRRGVVVLREPVRAPLVDVFPDIEHTICVRRLLAHRPRRIHDGTPPPGVI